MRNLSFLIPVNKEVSMSDKMKVYSKVYRALKQMMIHVKSNHVLILAMMITGIVMGKKAQLSEMSLHVPHKAKPDSIAKRFQRFVKNDNFEVEHYYLPFARAIIEHMAGETLYIAMDASQVGRNCMVLMVAVIYKGRALPLVWLVYKGKKGHTHAQRHIEALQKLKPLLAEQTSVVLLGDAEYDTFDMLTWVDETTDWAYAIRTEPRVLLTKNGCTFPARHLLYGDNCRTIASQVLFTAKQFGPAQVVACWEPPHKKPLYLISSLTSIDDICSAYGKRFKLETLFSDQKSRGFHIEKSHLSDPQRLARLLFAAALAYIWMIFQGLEVFFDHDKRSFIDRPNRHDKSLFRLGFDWLKVALTRGFDFNVLFHPPDLHLESGVR